MSRSSAPASGPASGSGGAPAPTTLVDVQEEPGVGPVLRPASRPTSRAGVVRLDARPLGPGGEKHSEAVAAAAAAGNGAASAAATVDAARARRAQRARIDVLATRVASVRAAQAEMTTEVGAVLGLGSRDLGQLADAVGALLLAARGVERPRSALPTPGHTSSAQEASVRQWPTAAFALSPTMPIVRSEFASPDGPAGVASCESGAAAAMAPSAPERAPVERAGEPTASPTQTAARAASDARAADDADARVGGARIVDDARGVGGARALNPHALAHVDVAPARERVLAAQLASALARLDAAGVCACAGEACVCGRGRARATAAWPPRLAQAPVTAHRPLAIGAPVPLASARSAHAVGAPRERRADGTLGGGGHVRVGAHAGQTLERALSERAFADDAHAAERASALMRTYAATRADVQPTAVELATAASEVSKVYRAHQPGGAGHRQSLPPVAPRLDDSRAAADPAGGLGACNRPACTSGAAVRGSGVSAAPPRQIIDPALDGAKPRAHVPPQPPEPLIVTAGASVRRHAAQASGAALPGKGELLGMQAMEAMLSQTVQAKRERRLAALAAYAAESGDALREPRHARTLSPGQARGLPTIAPPPPRRRMRRGELSADGPVTVVSTRVLQQAAGTHIAPAMLS